jgi:hypothetical protein
MDVLHSCLKALRAVLDSAKFKEYYDEDDQTSEKHYQLSISDVIADVKRHGGMRFGPNSFVWKDDGRVIASVTVDIRAEPEPDEDGREKCPEDENMVSFNGLVEDLYVHIHYALGTNCWENSRHTMHCMYNTGDEGSGYNNNPLWDNWETEGNDEWVKVLEGQLDKAWHMCRVFAEEIAPIHEIKWCGRRGGPRGGTQDTYRLIEDRASQFEKMFVDKFSTMRETSDSLILVGTRSWETTGFPNAPDLRRLLDQNWGAQGSQQEESQDEETEDEPLQCSLCMVNKKRISLSCGHVFCRGCLDRQKNNRDTSSLGDTCTVCKRISTKRRRIYL